MFEFGLGRLAKEKLSHSEFSHFQIMLSLQSFLRQACIFRFLALTSKLLSQLILSISLLNFLINFYSLLTLRVMSIVRTYAAFYHHAFLLFLRYFKEFINVLLIIQFFSVILPFLLLHMSFSLQTLVGSSLLLYWS